MQLMEVSRLESPQLEELPASRSLDLRVREVFPV